MSAEQLDALIAAAREDQQLADRLGAATTPEEALEIAIAAGYDITATDLEAYAGTLSERRGELTELQLTAVAGGCCSRGSFYSMHAVTSNSPCDVTLVGNCAFE